MKEARYWSYGGGALALAGLLTSAVATHYERGSVMPLWAYVGLIVFVAAFALIGVGDLLEAAEKRDYKVTQGVIIACIVLVAGIVITGGAILTNQGPLAASLGMAFGAMMLICGAVMFAFIRVKRLLKTLAPPPKGAASAAARIAS